MTIKFYKIADDYRVLNKTLGAVRKQLSVALLQSTSLSTPHLVLAYDSTIATCNYMEFVEIGKHYYFPQPVLSPGGRLVIDGKDDVLMNNKAEILGLSAYVVRSENSGNSLMNDSKFPVQANRHCKTIRFDSNPFAVPSDYTTTRCFTLTVVGGKNNE